VIKEAGARLSLLERKSREDRECLQGLSSQISFEEWKGLKESLKSSVASHRNTLVVESASNLEYLDVGPSSEADI
jgi:hypothetical protein